MGDVFVDRKHHGQYTRDLRRRKAPLQELDHIPVGLGIPFHGAGIVGGRQLATDLGFQETSHLDFVTQGRTNIVKSKANLELEQAGSGRPEPACWVVRVNTGRSDDGVRMRAAAPS